MAITNLLDDPNKIKIQPFDPNAPNFDKSSFLATANQPNDAPAQTQPSGIIAKATGYTPEKVTLNPATDTVEGRVANIVSKNSPLLQDARTRAAQAANSRGLINSSIAVGEGEKAVIQSALPIAQQDASAAVNVAQTNAAAGNQAAQFGAGAENTAQLQAAQGAQAIAQLKLSGSQEQQLQQLKGAQANDLAMIENNARQLLQSSASAAQIFSQISASIADILKEPNIPVEQKQQLVQKQIELLQNGLAVVGGISNLDLGTLLDFSTPIVSPEQEEKAKQAEAEKKKTEDTRKANDDYLRQILGSEYQ